MASKVEICNRALLKLGQPTIMSLSDDSVRARQCFQEFESAFGAVLREYNWPFAIRRALLARLQEVPVYGPQYFYKLPEDLARVISINTGGLPYQIEGSKVATDTEEVQVRYVSKAISPEDLDEQTSEVVALRLAYSLSLIVTENLQLKDMLFKELSIALAQARHTWSVEDFPQEAIEGPWLVAHNYSSTADAYSIGNPWGMDGTGVTNG